MTVTDRLRDLPIWFSAGLYCDCQAHHWWPNGLVVRCSLWVMPYIGFTLCERSRVRTPVGPRAFFLLPLNPHRYDPCSELVLFPQKHFRSFEDSRNDALENEVSWTLLYWASSLSPYHEAQMVRTRVTSAKWQSPPFFGDHFEVIRGVGTSSDHTVSVQVLFVLCIVQCAFAPPCHPCIN